MKGIETPVDNLRAIKSCIGFNRRLIRIGDMVLTPAGSSDPVCGKAIAILPISWPTLQSSQQQLGCLIEVVFGEQERMYLLAPSETVMGIDSIPDVDGKVIANCICHVATTNKDSDGNAAVIASAPELAEALRELHDFCELSQHHRYSERSKAAFDRAAELLKRIGF